MESWRCEVAKLFSARASLWCNLSGDGGNQFWSDWDRLMARRDGGRLIGLLPLGLCLNSRMFFARLTMAQRHGKEERGTPAGSDSTQIWTLQALEEPK